jgi:hypothetical protein
MKLLLVLGSDESYDLISRYVKPLGFDLIRYRHVLKAMDNIDEADPTAIIVSARDFPRHWKIMVQFVRYEKPKETCPIIILKGDNFPLEETSRAFFLGVSGIVSESLEDPNEIERLKSILSRYIPVDEKRKSHRYYAEGWNRFGLLISNPADKAVIWGEVKTISSVGLSFSPAYSTMMKDITLDMQLEECSLRAGDAILSPVCRLVRTGRIVSLEFVSFPGNEKATFDDYLESLPILELKHQKKHTAETQAGR